MQFTYQGRDFYLDGKNLLCVRARCIISEHRNFIEKTDC